jgi:hypothetical protein
MIIANFIEMSALNAKVEESRLRIDGTKGIEANAVMNEQRAPTAPRYSSAAIVKS